MPTYIRLTDYKSSSEKEQAFFNPDNRYEAKQEDFSKVSGTPLSYSIKNTVRDVFNNGNTIDSISEPRVGLGTGNNDLFLRFWFEVNYKKVQLQSLNGKEALLSKKKWFPYNKGGEFRKWYGNQDFIINWENDGQDIRKSLIGKNPNIPRSVKHYFKKSITWTLLSNKTFGVRALQQGSIFDVNGMSLFVNDKLYNYMVSFLSSKLSFYFLKILNPTLAFQVGNIKNLPIILPAVDVHKQHIETLTQQNIDISKEEWDSNETSWYFIKNELIKHKSDTKMETAYTSYCNYWKEKFNTLHENEEELNRLLIDIYELQDELDEKVELKDITILKNEAKIVEGELVFQADEIMKQFISYAVGVMFGRYSLDSDGLLIANIGQEVPSSTTFEIDDDNVIPVLEDDYFTDDIASRFVAFVKTVFGEESLSENIVFIEGSLGVTLRKYFVKGFYEDHIKRYKKRPIYWMVASPKKGFMSLMYMHRYTSDIFATVQNGYVREYMTKLEASKENAQREADDASNSATQRSRASKSVEKINKTLDEIIKFDRETLTSFAQSRIEIDLDDGVKVNYCKFKEVLFEFDKKLCK